MSEILLILRKGCEGGYLFNFHAKTSELIWMKLLLVTHKLQFMLKKNQNQLHAISHTFRHTAG